MVFFELMEQQGFKIIEKANIPLPVFAMDQLEEIEIFVFELDDSGEELVGK